MSLSISHIKKRPGNASTASKPRGRRLKDCPKAPARWERDEHVPEFNGFMYYGLLWFNMV